MNNVVNLIDCKTMVDSLNNYWKDVCRCYYNCREHLSMCL